MQYKINIQAGQWARQQTNGQQIILVDTAGQKIDIRTEMRGQTVNEFYGMGKGFAFIAPSQFDSLYFQSAVTTSIDVIITSGRAQVNMFDGATINANVVNEVEVKNDAGSPLNVTFPPNSGMNVVVQNEVEVKNDAGNPLAVTLPAGVELEVKNEAGNPLSVSLVNPVALTRGDACGNELWVGICDSAKMWSKYGNATANDTPTAFWGADPKIGRMTIRNTGDKAIYIAREPVTYQSCAIKIEAGDIWSEETFAKMNQDYFCSCEPGQTSDFAIEVFYKA